MNPAPMNPARMYPARMYQAPMNPAAPNLTAAPPPVHVTGPDGPWEEVSAGLELRGSVVVYATWGSG